MIVLKILLIILLAVLALIFLLLVLPVSAKASFIDKKLKYEVSFAWVPVIDSDGGGLIGWFQRRKNKTPEKEDNGDDELLTDEYTGDKDDISADSPDPAKADEPASEDNAHTDKQEKKAADDNSSEADNSKDKADDSGKKTLGEKVGTLLDIWSCAKEPAAKIFRGIHLEDIYIDFIIADEDAYKCALNYGRISAALYNGLAQLSRVFTVRFRTVDVRCGFGIEKSQWDGALKVRFCLGTAVLSGIWVIGAYLFRVLIPGKIKSKKAKKSAAEQS